MVSLTFSCNAALCWSVWFSVWWFNIYKTCLLNATKTANGCHWPLSVHLLYLYHPISLFSLLLPCWLPLNYNHHFPLSPVFTSPLSCFTPGGCQGPAGGGATRSGAQPGPVRHHGSAEAGRDQGADPPRDPQGAEDQRRCWEPAQGNITAFFFFFFFLKTALLLHLHTVGFLGKESKRLEVCSFLVLHWGLME